MRITTKKPLRPRGRSDEKRQSTKVVIRDVHANRPQREVQIIRKKGSRYKHGAAKAPCLRLLLGKYQRACSGRLCL